MTKTQKLVATPLLAVMVLAGGAIAGYAGLVSAQTADSGALGVVSTTSANTHQRGGGNFDPKKGGHKGANGVTETLLTGDTAAKVTASAQVALPGSTIERVETDAEGAAYEAHVMKADGSHVTLKFDTNFAVTPTEDGHGQRTNQ